MKDLKEYVEASRLGLFKLGIPDTLNPAQKANVSLLMIYELIKQVEELKEVVGKLTVKPIAKEKGEERPDGEPPKKPRGNPNFGKKGAN